MRNRDGKQTTPLEVDAAWRIPAICLSRNLRSGCDVTRIPSWMEKWIKTKLFQNGINYFEINSKETECYRLFLRLLSISTSFPCTSFEWRHICSIFVLKFGLNILILGLSLSFEARQCQIVLSTLLVQVPTDDNIFATTHCCVSERTFPRYCSYLWSNFLNFRP